MITIETKHTYGKTEAAELLSYFKTFQIIDSDERAKLEFIQWNSQNKAYLRVYVPLGASLVWSGSDITTENSEYATIFSMLIETPVWSTASKSWKYNVDIPNCVDYDKKIDWTIQPGLREVIMK